MTDTRILELGEQECWSRLGAASIGRLAVSAGGEIDIFPVNFAVDGKALVFRTSPGTKLMELTVHDAVAFEVDGIDGHEAFSVVVKGRAEQLQHADEVAAARATGLHSWSATPKDRWVRITPSLVTGRRFPITPAVGDDDEPDDSE